MRREELGVATVGELNELITGKTNKKSSCRDITDLILVQEALMEKRMAHIADAIAKDPKKKIILIAGPSSSGKTTFSICIFWAFFAINKIVVHTNWMRTIIMGIWCRLQAI